MLQKHKTKQKLKETLYQKRAVILALNWTLLNAKELLPRSTTEISRQMTNVDPN